MEQNVSLSVSMIIIIILLLLDGNVMSVGFVVKMEHAYFIMRCLCIYMEIEEKSWQRKLWSKQQQKEKEIANQQR